MLKPYDRQRISEYTNLYDLIAGKEHLLRKIKDNIDFSFVNPMLKKSYCEHFGRPAKEPEMMFKQEFLKKLYDLSDEALIENINSDGPPLQVVVSKVSPYKGLGIISLRLKARFRKQMLLRSP